MCLGVPGQVVEWIERDSIFARALVEFSGATRECQMACVQNVKVGDYVVVHAGIAISKVDEKEANRAIVEWQSMESHERADGYSRGTGDEIR